MAPGIRPGFHRGPFGRMEPWNGGNEMRGAVSLPALEFSAIVVVRSCATPWRTLSTARDVGGHATPSKPQSTGQLGMFRGVST